MEKVELKLTENGRGYFYFIKDEEELGEMEICISDKEITLFHTEVKPKEKGKGIAKKLFLWLVNYSRSNDLKIIALCPFVLAQLNRYPGKFDDVWQNKK